ncbi:MAG: DUF4157 domain-containing protein [Bacteroidota bacterium]
MAFQSTRRSRRQKNHRSEDPQKNQPFFSKTSDTVQARQEDAFFQPKLTIGQPNDKYEQEADAVADAVVDHAGPTPAVQQKEISSIQRVTLATPQEDEKLGTAEQRMEEDKLIQEKPELQKMGDEEEEEVQMKSAAASNTASPQVSQKIKSKAGSGQKLSPQIRAEMEAGIGADFSQVNIHTDADAVQMNKELGAQAFTHGQDIYFNAGKYQPENGGGKRLLAHELTHVVQQSKTNDDSIQKQATPISQCHGTNRIGNLSYPGTLEHIAIQQHYITHINPLAEIEYFIPNSGSGGGPGYADIVDPLTGGIYEAKFFPFAASAVPEVLNYVAKANIHCDPETLWHAGLIYPPSVIPFTGNLEIVSYLFAPGVIGYWTRIKVPVTPPVPVLDKVKEFIEDVVESGEDAYEAARRFLQENPEVVDYIETIAASALIAAAVVIVVATIIEDIVTLGAGIADDPASFAAAYALVRVAMRMI